MEAIEVSLGEICEFIRGVTFPAAEAHDAPFSGSVACLATSGVQADVAWDSRRYISGSRVVSPQRLLRSGDILISTANSKELVGKSCLVRQVPYPCTFGAFVTTARPNGRVLPEYLSHWMTARPFRHWCFRASSNTTNISNLRVSELEELRLKLPDLAEQKRIAVILDRTDRLRRLRRHSMRCGDQFLTAVFVSLFGNPSEGKGCWDEVPLAKLLREGDKINYGVVQPGTDLSKGVRLVRVADMDDLENSSSHLKLIHPAIDKQHSASRLCGDEILVACVGATLGKVAKAIPNLRGCNIARAVARVPGDWHRIERDFLAHYLTTSRVQDFFTKQARTVAQATLNIAQIEETPVIMPPPRLQQCFAEEASRFERLRTIHREWLRQAEHLFQTLLHRAFTSRI